jgi:hypothetical protein
MAVECGSDGDCEVHQAMVQNTADGGDEKSECMILLGSRSGSQDMSVNSIVYMVWQ